MVISISYLFDEIMEYHPDNWKVYDEIKQFLPKLVPFVGAGLTQFVYCSWPTALEKFSDKLTNRTDKQKALDLIKAKRYLDCAQLLENLRTPNNLAHDIAQLFSANKLEQNREKLRTEPIILLPALFPDLVLTTNFDETLETVYEESSHSFQRVFLPGHPELLKQFIRQGGTHGLFKLHGTLTGELIEYEKIVFTRYQYNKHYKKFSPLTRDLKSCFKHRIMLFLGCSLENDRTMELLQNVIRFGNTHYAIIDCEQSKRDEKIRQLGKKHIRAILYEQGCHEAVRVILEHLLEETNPAAYDALPIHVGTLSPIAPTERFSYKAGIVPFTGRDHELQELHSFLCHDESISFCWWAVIGPGGSGKSRLAYEFQQQLPSDWTVRYLGANDYEDLSALTGQLTQKTLLIADYVQENAKELGKWMERLNEKNRCLPIRILLVERDSAWTTQLYENVHHRQELKSACYQKFFLTLHMLQDDDLMLIMKNYASVLAQKGGYKKNILPIKEKKLLLQKLKSIDPELCRPLYAMFLTDAYMAGQNPEHWNCDDILDYVIKREQDRLKFNLQRPLGMPLDENLYNACLYLQIMATVLQNASLETLKKLCPRKWDVLQQKSVSFISPASILEKTGLAVNGEISALRPDLIGEYFVYTWLLENQNEKKQFLRAIWQEPDSTGLFFYRMFNDYGYLLNENPKHWELFLPNIIPSSEREALFYGMFVVNVIHFCEIVKICQQQVELLKNMSLRYPENLEIVILFAEGLTNLITKQNEPEASETIKQLEQLVFANPNVSGLTSLLAEGFLNLSTKQNEKAAQKTIWHLEYLTLANQKMTKIAILFAKGLINLCCKQDELRCKNTVERLEMLATTHPDVPDIAILFAEGLKKLIFKQGFSNAWMSIRRLECLMADNPDIPEITTELALGLYQLSFDQDKCKVKECTEKLERLVASNPDELTIVNAFSNGLFNLSNLQNEKEVQETVNRIEKLASAYPDILEFTIRFAESLANLTAKQNEENALETVKRLRKLTIDKPNMSEIAYFFAMGLFNLSGKQDGKRKEETIQCLEHLAATYPNTQEIAVFLASGLLNLSLDQDADLAAKTVERLKKLSIIYSNVPEIANYFAQSLVNLCILQDELDAYESIRQLEELLDIYPNTQKIIVMLGRGLLNISIKQDKHKIYKTIKRLNSLVITYPDIPEIAIAFAQALVNLIHKQDIEETPDSIRHLEQLAATYPNELDIIISLTRGLVILSQKQDKKGIQESIMRLEQIRTTYSNVLDIEILFAQSLVNLSYKQNEAEAQKTVNQLELLLDTYPNIQDITTAFIQGLLNLSHKQEDQKARDTISRLEDYLTKNSKWFM